MESMTKINENNEIQATKPKTNHRKARNKTQTFTKERKTKMLGHEALSTCLATPDTVPLAIVF